MEFKKLKAKSNKSDINGAATVLAESFRDDPFYSGRGIKNIEAFTGLMNCLIKTSLELDHVVTVSTINGQIVGTSLVVPSGAKEIGITRFPRFAANAIRSFGFRGAIRYAKDVVGLTHNQSDDYLSMVGVLNEARGKGVGGGLIQNVIYEAAVNNRGVSLETMNPANLSLYKNYGFEQTKEQHDSAQSSSRGDYVTYSMRKAFERQQDEAA